MIHEEPSGVARSSRLLIEGEEEAHLLSELAFLWEVHSSIAACTSPTALELTTTPQQLLRTTVVGVREAGASEWYCPPLPTLDAYCFE